MDTDTKAPEDLLRDGHFRHLLEEMNGFFLTLNEDLHITYANRKVQRELGYKPGALVGRSILSLVAPEMECETAFRLERMMEEQSPGECLTRVCARSGPVFVVKARGTPLMKAGRAVGLSIVAEDVTEYERQRETLEWRSHRMDTISGCMTDVMMSLDKDLNIIYATPSVKRIAGYEPDLLEGVPLFSLLHPADRKLVRQAALESVSQQEGIACQYRMRHQEGHYIWMEAAGSPLTDESGSHNGFIVSNRDVTARVEYERALLKSRRNLEALFDTMQEGFGLWRAVRDKNGKIKDLRCLDANGSFLRATRLQREQLIGQLNSKAHTQLDDHWMSVFDEVIDSGQPRSFEGYSRQLKRYYEIYAFSPGKDQLACMFVDATRRIMTEKQLAEDRNWLKVVLGSVNEGIIATDVCGQVLFLNQKAAVLMGWKEEEAVGQSLSGLFSAVQTIPLGQPAAPATQSSPDMLTTPGAASELEVQPAAGENLTLTDNTIVINRAGCRSIISNSSAPIYDPDGNNLGMVMVLSDITDQRQALEKIEYLSFNDALTGLYNRAYVDHINNGGMMGPRELPMSIILGDVNGLKLTNDVFGHLEGDRLLQKTAAILKDSCRDSDVTVRWGGDEFLLMLPRSDERAADMVCQRIRAKCREAGEDPVEISISLGFATLISMDQDIKDVFRQAEDRMYECKCREKQSSRGALIASLERNLWRRSFESPEHNWRVRELAMMIGSRLGLKGTELEHLALLALLHDIGKVGIQSELLTKSGPLTAEETQQLRKHSEIGYRMAEVIPELKPIAECIWCSHEAWDGSGYPRGLQGQEIPLMSRIIHLVHSYDVAAHGVYKPALGKEEARLHMLECRGKAHDPRLVDIMMQILDREPPE